MRGAGLKRCPLRQPAFEEDPTLTVGKAEPGTSGKVPPVPPHWTKPFSGLPVPAPVFNDPSPVKLGCLSASKAMGTRLSSLVEHTGQIRLNKAWKSCRGVSCKSSSRIVILFDV